jgi:flagellar basal-body rod protein FlgB
VTIESQGGDLLMRLMSSTALRRDVLANNIASQNLPGYRRRDVQFEELLSDALQKGERPRDLNRISPEIVTDFDTPARADGNNVSAEEEASLMRENRIRFELYAMILKGRTSLISQAINSDR